MAFHTFLSLFASTAMAVDTGNGGDTGGCSSWVFLDISRDSCFEGQTVSIHPRICTGEPLPEGAYWDLYWDAPGYDEMGHDESMSPTSWLCPEIEVEPGVDGLRFRLYAHLYDSDGAWLENTFGDVAVIDSEAVHTPTTSPGDQGCAGESSCSVGGRGGIGGSLGLLVALALAWVRRTSV